MTIKTNLLSLAIFLLPAVLLAQPTVQRDIAYTDSGLNAHHLDFYPLESNQPAPLIVWTHGGAWRGGSKDGVSAIRMREKGWAIASVEYRLSGEAPFPAMIHDIKAAIRYLRANAKKLNIDPNRFVIAGDSAGGHLAALVGLSNGDSYLEGTLGNHLETSSDIQAIVSLFGAHNLTSILAQSTPHGLNVRKPALELLFDGPIEERQNLATLASPVHYVNERSIPILLIHGDQDPQMPINQSHEMHGLCKEHGVTVQFEVIHGGKHGGPKFLDDERLALIDYFLKRSLVR